MEFKIFLKSRRFQLGITQEELARRLTSFGHETGSKRVGHWETGRNKPPLEDAGFRDALARSLEMDINTLLDELGYIVDESELSLEARRAANIVEHLPPAGRQLAIDYLQVLEKNFTEN
jgi:transcriptional regulator with XRE-family HTH domain